MSNTNTFSFTASTPKSPSRRTSSSTGVNSLAPLDSISSPTRRSTSSTPTSGTSSLRSSNEFYQGECDRFIPSRSASNLEDAFERMDSYDPLENQSADGTHSNQNLMNNLLRSELLGEPMMALKADISNATNGINGVIGTSMSPPSRNRTPNMLRFSSGGVGSSGSSGSTNSPGNTLGNSPLGSSRGGFGASPSAHRLSHSFSGSKKSTRKISRIPYKVLDAPALADDYYLNLVDWSSSNLLSVALGSSVYLWSACNSKVTKLCDLEGGDSVTALSWALKGTYLAIGTNTGKVLLWDTVRGEQVRELQSHTSRVGTIAWSTTVLASGSRDRNIYLQDVRVPGGTNGSSERSSNTRLNRPIRSTNAIPPGSRQMGITISGSSGSRGGGSVHRGATGSVERAPSRPSVTGGNRPSLQRGYGYDDDDDDRYVDRGRSGTDDFDLSNDMGDNEIEEEEEEEDGEEQEEEEGEAEVPVPSSSSSRGVSSSSSSSSSTGPRRSTGAASAPSSSSIRHIQRISRRRTSNGDVDDDDRVQEEEEDTEVRESFSLFDDDTSFHVDDGDGMTRRLNNSHSHGSAMDLQGVHDHTSQTSMTVGDHDHEGGVSSSSSRWTTNSPGFGDMDMDFTGSSGSGSHHDPLSTAAMGLAAAQLTAPSSSSGGRGTNWRDIHARADTATSAPSWSSRRIHTSTSASSSSSGGSRRGASSIPAAASASSISRFVPASSRLLSEWPASSSSSSHAPATAVGSFLAANANSSSAASRSSSAAADDFDGLSGNSDVSPCLVGELQAHKQEVCGLKWSYDDRMLASGGNDNKLFVWIPQLGGTGNHPAGSRTAAGGMNSSHGTATVETNPVCRFGDHNAAVKAVGWSPHQHGTLASGGGTADRHIRFWNALTATSMHRIDTGSQVCNLMWSKNVNEIVSTHGYSLNQVGLIDTLVPHHHHHHKNNFRKLLSDSPPPLPPPYQQPSFP